MSKRMPLQGVSSEIRFAARNLILATTHTNDTLHGRHLPRPTLPYKHHHSLPLYLHPSLTLPIAVFTAPQSMDGHLPFGYTHRHKVSRVPARSAGAILAGGRQLT